MPTALVAVAGAVGAVLRYRLGVAIGVRSFPWATLAVNVVGSFAFGAVLGANRLSTTATAAVAAGLLGAFTTFSTFGFETFTFLRTGREGMAAAYVAASVAGGLAATALGWALGRAVS